MKKDQSVYLEHILISINRIEEYVKEIDYENFNKNNMLQDALIRQVEIIGEASSRISKEIKDKYKEISWIDIKNMRNKLIHDYFGINLLIVWKTVQDDIPGLKIQILKILSDINPQIHLNYQ